MRLLKLFVMARLFGYSDIANCGLTAKWPEAFKTRAKLFASFRFHCRTFCPYDVHLLPTEQSHLAAIPLLNKRDIMVFQ
jgi:hypothetical protein